MISQLVLMIEINQTEKIRFKTSMLRLALCDYSDAYIVVKGMITVTDPDNEVFGIITEMKQTKNQQVVLMV